MSTFTDRPHTALLVVDVQRDVMATSIEAAAVIGRIVELVDRARAAQVPVVWVQHSDGGLERGSEGWQIVDDLQPASQEPLVHKSYGDAFEGTTLEEELAALRAGHLVVTGAQTDMCIRSTIHGGFARGYDVTLVSDAHTTEDLSAYGAPPPEAVIAHTNLYWAEHGGPGKQAAVKGCDDVRFDDESASAD